MNRFQFAAFLLVAFLGCFLGGLVARMGPSEAHAQVAPTNPRQIPGIRNEDVLFVPNGGLRIVDYSNRLLGMLGEQGGGTFLTLMDSSGRPSVSILAGPGGQAVISCQSSASLKVMAGTGAQTATLEASSAGPSLQLGNLVTLTGTTDGGRVTVNDRQGQAALRLDSTSEGGRLVGQARGGKTLFEMMGGADGGRLTLRSSDGQAGFQAVAGAQILLSKGDKTLFRAPSDE
jgi:hypothetical protein